MDEYMPLTEVVTMPMGGNWWISNVIIDETPDVKAEKWTVFELNPKDADEVVKIGITFSGAINRTFLFDLMTEQDYADLITLLLLFWRVRLPFWRWN